MSSDKIDNTVGSSISSDEKVNSDLAKRADKIITHMNLDHEDSIKAYLRYYAKLGDATGGKITSISSAGLTLNATLLPQNTESKERIKEGIFVAYPSGKLENAAHAKTVLIEMHKEAYSKLGIRYKLENGYYKMIVGFIWMAFTKSKRAKIIISSVAVIIAYKYKKYCDCCDHHHA